MKRHCKKLFCIVLSILLAAAVCSLCGCSSDSKAPQTGAYTADTLPPELTQPTLPTFGTGTILPPDVFTDPPLPDEIASEISEAMKDMVDFVFEVTGADGVTNSQIISTDCTTVGEALLSYGMIEGEEGEYGLYIKTVLGETHDYDDDGMYWAFYIDGEYASSGVDTTEIVPGTVYALRAE